MSTKPSYIFLYKSDNAVKNLMNHFPLSCENIVNMRQSFNETDIEYEHIDIRCKRVDSISQNLRGNRTWQILVEECLYENITQEQMDNILLPIMVPLNLFGGRVVSVRNC